MEIKIKKPSAMIQTNVKELTLIQRKLINFIIYVAQKDGEQKDYKIDLCTIKESCKIKSTENVDIKEQFRSLRQIIIEFNCLDKDKNEVWQSVNIISAVEITRNTGKVVFEIPNMLKKKILNPELYAPLNIVLIAGLKSKYSIVLYELFRDYLYSPAFPELTIAQFKELLGVPSTRYNRFHNFKEKILDRAVNEINKATDIVCSYTLLKTKGNKYSHIKFKIGKKINFKLPKKIETHKKNLELFFDAKKIPSEILKLLPEKYQIESIYNLIQPYFDDLGFLVSNIKYSNKHCKENYPAYLKLALKNDYAKTEREVKEKKQSIIQEKNNHIQEKQNKEKLLKQKAWDYFNSLPEAKQFELKEKVKTKLKKELNSDLIEDNPRIKKYIINAQIEKDLVEILKNIVQN